jgi:hypothetical protein
VEEGTHILQRSLHYRVGAKAYTFRTPSHCRVDRREEAVHSGEDDGSVLYFANHSLKGLQWDLFPSQYAMDLFEVGRRFFRGKMHRVLHPVETKPNHIFFLFKVPIALEQLLPRDVVLPILVFCHRRWWEDRLDSVDRCPSNRWDVQAIL